MHVITQRNVQIRSGVGAVFRGVLEAGGCLKGAAPSRREEVRRGGVGGVKYVTRGDLVAITGSASA